MDYDEILRNLNKIKICALWFSNVGENLRIGEAAT